MSLFASLMTRKAGIAASLAVTIVAALNGAAAKAANTVFSDTFGSGSTVNAATNATPTASSTSYQVASTKNSPAATIASGDLQINQVATTSGVIETQALFASSPVALQNAGDFVDYQITFTDTNVGITGNSDTLYFGLYNSGGSAPLNGLSTSGLSASGTASTGGVAGWQGYVWQLSPASTTSTGKTITRPTQTGTTSANQDLVANGASGGTFSSPGGTTIPSNFVNASAAGLANATVYTEDLNIMLNADGSETITNTFVQDNADTTTTVIANQTVNTSPTLTTPIATSFDGLAFGWRHSGVSATSAMGVSNITVSSNVVTAPVPEPASVGIVALGALTLLSRRRKA